MSSTTPESFVEELKALVAKNVSGQLQVIARVNDLVRRAGEPGGASRDTSDILSTWLAFNLASYATVSTHTLAMLDELIGAAERALLSEAPPTRAAPRAPTEPVEMRLEGRRGDRVALPFLVENPYGRALTVTFEAEPLVGAGGGAALPATHVVFEPERLDVPPGGQAIAHAVVVLSHEFAVAETYRTTIRTHGFEGREILLSITVLRAARRAARPRAADAAPPSRSRAPRKRGAQDGGAAGT